MNENLSSMTGKQIPDPAAMLENATGTAVDPERMVLSDTKPIPPIATPLDEIPKSVEPVVVRPVSTPTTNPIPIIPGGGQQILSAEDVAAMGIDTSGGKKIDVVQEQFAQENRRFHEQQTAKQQETMAMFQEAMAAEEDRLERADATLADEEAREELLGNTTSQPSGTVTYDQISLAERKKDSRRSTDPEIDPYDLMPAYSEDEVDEDESPSTDEKKETDPNPNDAEYGQFIREMEVVTLPESDANVVKTIRDPVVEITDSGRKRNNQPLGDQAFLNAITKFKKDKFGKVTVVLPNSGFTCDIVGTGVVDLTNLYMNVDQNMTTYDYQLEQMRTIIKNVTGTSPRVDPRDLANMIHHRDFMILAFGHICATMKTVETVANCTECGKAFRITSRPNDLLINMDDMQERRIQIENAPNIEAYSLMSRNRTVYTSIGIEVTIGHPSYAELIRCIRSFQSYSQNMTAADAHRFESMLQLLNMVRKIKLPNDVTAANIFQNYQALQLLAQEDLEKINREVNDMNKDVIEPKFGIREVTCPHCKQVVKDIAYEGLLDLLFYHTTVSSYLNNPES